MHASAAEHMSCALQCDVLYKSETYVQKLYRSSYIHIILFNEKTHCVYTLCKSYLITEQLWREYIQTHTRTCLHTYKLSPLYYQIILYELALLLVRNMLKIAIQFKDVGGNNEKKLSFVISMSETQLVIKTLQNVSLAYNYLSYTDGRKLFVSQRRYSQLSTSNISKYEKEEDIIEKPRFRTEIVNCLGTST